MPAEMIIKSEGSWHKIFIEYRGNPNHVFPLLEKDWTSQEAVDLILDTCGKGVKMVFANRGKDGTKPAKSVSTNWYDGENFDHSPSWSNSPINPLSSKMVGNDYFNGPHGRETIKNSYKTLEEAIDKASCKHVYTWNGVKWEHVKTVSKQKRVNPWRKRKKSK